VGRIRAIIKDPQRLTRRARIAIGATDRVSFQTKLDLDLLERPHYAYCLANAARLAKALKIPAISALEFGVAGGAGLIALEDLAAPIEDLYGVRIQVWGFDTGEGLPPPVDYRDLPYVWQEGFFRMDQEELRRRLSRAQLVLGDVRETVPTFLEKYRPAPIGAVFCDLDYWSSTRDSLAIFQGDQNSMLPRVFCYFDDIVSVEGVAYYCEDVGQLRAIRDYNEVSEMRKLRQIAGLTSIRQVKALWNSKIYVHHAFDHLSYCTYVQHQPDMQLELPS
jgi:hypothetical protein